MLFGQISSVFKIEQYKMGKWFHLVLWFLPNFHKKWHSFNIFFFKCISGGSPFQTHMQRCWGYFKFRRLRGRTSTYFLYGKMRKRICGFLDFRPEITHFDAAYLVYIPIIIIFRKRKKKTSVVVQKTNLFEPRKTEWVFIVCRLIIISHLSAAASYSPFD